MMTRDAFLTILTDALTQEYQEHFHTVFSNVHVVSSSENVTLSQSTLKQGNGWVGSCLPLPYVSALVPLSLSDTPQPLSLAVWLDFCVFLCFYQSPSTASGIVSISRHFGAKLLNH